MPTIPNRRFLRRTTNPWRLLALPGILVIFASTGLGQDPNSSILVGPNQIDAGSGSVVLNVIGTGFTPSSSVRCNNTPLATTYLAPSQLTAILPATFTATSGPYTMTVSNSNGAVSQSYPIYIQPVLLSVSPSSVPTGFQGATVTLSGIGFNSSDQANVWPLSYATSTTYVNPTTLSLTIPASDLQHSLGALINVQQSGCCFSRQLPLTIGNPPVVTSVSPNAVKLGNPSFTLTISGSNFDPGSLVYWNGNPIPTIFINSTQLSAAASSVLPGVGPGTVPLWVVNSDGGRSAPITVALDPPVPTISSLVPASAPAGGPSFTLTVSGSGFLSTSKILWNDVPLDTTYISSSVLTAVVSASLTAAAGIAVLSVGTLGTGAGVTSGTVVFPIGNVTPTITAVTPQSVPAGLPALALTVTGAGFFPSAVIQWNGTPLQTNFISSGQLSAVVPGNLIAIPAAVAISVSAAAGISNPFPFTVTPPVPTTATSWIVNWASGQPGIAPGSLISIYGGNLASGEVFASGVPLPLSLGDTSVTINGRPAPLFYVGPYQINAQVPFETELGTASLVVKNKNLDTGVVQFAVTAISPGLVMLGSSTHALLWNDRDGSVNSSDHPAAPGDYVTTYLTGQGGVDHAVATGAPAPSDPFSMPKAPVTVIVGTRQAQVTFAGLAPGTVGILQLNFQIPTVLAGEQLLTISIGNVAAKTAVISVGNPPSPPAN